MGEPKEPWIKDHWMPGVLSERQMKILQEDQYIQKFNENEYKFDHSSMDLHLTDIGYLMCNGSIKPRGGRYAQIFTTNYCQKMNPGENGCFSLKKGQCYVFKLNERIPLLRDSNVFGQATAKSSVGRVDVIARLIVDGMHQYDYFNPQGVNEGTGDMFLEVIPIGFNVNVKAGISLNQIRFFLGKMEDSEIKDETLIRSILHGSTEDGGYLSVDLTSDRIGGLETVAFRAESTNPDFYIDIWSEEGKETPPPWDHWLFEKPNNGNLIIRDGAFYIIRSKEKISLPASVAVYCRAMDESLGEMRIHYAGFAHPFFGYKREDGKPGTPLIFEVRGHNVNVVLQDNERLAKLIFYRMSEDAVKREQKKKKRYDTQVLELSGYFDVWPQKLKWTNKEKGQVEPDEGEAS
jgi:deoxycytidine triphosphate deaminase